MKKILTYLRNMFGGKTHLDSREKMLSRPLLFRSYEDAFDYWTQMIPLQCLTDEQLIGYLKEPMFEDHIDEILDEMNERKKKKHKTH